MTDEKKFEVHAEITARLTQQDVYDIMVSALEGGINYWCRRVVVQGKYLGEYASDQISRGGQLAVWLEEPFEDDKTCYMLDLDKFLAGFKQWLENCYANCDVVDSTDGSVDCGQIDACQCAVTAAVGVNDFRMDNFAVCSFIKLELFGVAEMLKNLTVFIGNCNFHNGISFTIFVGFFWVSSLHTAVAAAVGCLLSSADAVVSSGDVQRLPMDKARCDFAPCAFVNLLHGRAGNIHLCGTLLVGLLLQVNQPNNLVFVQRQQDRLGIFTSVGAEGINLWCATNSTAPWRSWHGRFPPSVFGIYRL